MVSDYVVDHLEVSVGTSLSIYWKAYDDNGYVDIKKKVIDEIIEYKNENMDKYVNVSAFNGNDSVDLHNVCDEYNTTNENISAIEDGLILCLHKLKKKK